MLGKVENMKLVLSKTKCGMIYVECAKPVGCWVFETVGI